MARGTLTYDIEIDDTEFVRLWNSITDDAGVLQLRKAAGTALRRVRQGARVFMTEADQDVYNIKARPFTSQVRISQVRRANLSFIIWGTNKPISLIHFGSRGGTVNQTARGVSVIVRKDKFGGRKVIRRAFIRRDVRNNLRIFTRFTGDRQLMPNRTMKAGTHLGKDRTGIRALRGPSAADMLFDVEIDEKLAPVVQERFLIEFANQSKFFGVR